MTPDPGDELVPLYDASGRPSGEVYVHRRTDTKDVFPGHHDFAAGGVLSDMLEQD